LVAAAGWRGAFWILGLLALGLSIACAILVRDRPMGSGARPASPRAVDVLGMVRVVHNPRTWPPFLAFFFFYAAMGNLMLWAVPFLRDVYGLGMTRAALYAMATSLALVISAPVTGYLSDHVLKRRKLPSVVLTVTCFLLWLVFVATLGAL